MGLKAGSLNRRVSILRRGAPVDDGYTTAPAPYEWIGARFASVKPRMGREAVEAGGREARTIMSFWMRRDALARTITADDALELDGVRYEIVAPPIEVGAMREGIEVLAVAGGQPVAEVA